TKPDHHPSLRVQDARTVSNLQRQIDQEKAMHDIDRTQMEYWAEVDGMEAGDYEYMGEEEDYSGGTGGVLSEADEMELAAELLEISSEEELDQFLGDLAKNVTRAAGRVLKSHIGQAIVSQIKPLARQALS